MVTEKTGTIDYDALPPLSANTAHSMKEEFSVSLWLAVVYFIFLLGVTILDFTAPDFMKIKLWGGMTVTWFATGIVAMIMAALIAWIHVYIYQKRIAQNS